MLLVTRQVTSGRVMYVDEVVHHNDGFCQGHKAHAPQSVHNLSRLTGVLLLDGDNHQIVEHPLGGAC